MSSDWAEAKANELVVEHWPNITTKAVPSIVSALREAEERMNERAALLIEQQDYNDWWSGGPASAKKAREAHATAIRSLKKEPQG